MTGLEVTLKYVFWISAALILHNYLLFGWTIRLLAQLAPNRKATSGELPKLTIVIAAHNEELVISRTLAGILAQDYPREKVEIVVGSDVSTDKTEAIIQEYADRRVRLVAFKERHGKLGILDEMIPQITEGVVVVMDANILLGEGALRKIGERYSDPMVGAVCGRQTVELPGRTTELTEENRYRAGEVALKIRLSKLGAVVGAFGGCYSFRREYFRPIGTKPMVDDVIIPLEVLSQRKRVVFEPAAVAYEEIGSTPSEEFRRRIRMTAYNLNGLTRAVRLGARGGLLSLYVVVSYKVLRWLSAYLIGLWAISAISLSRAGIIYKVSTELAALALLLALGGYIIGQFGKRAPILSSAYYFSLMNISLYIGLFRWMFGVQQFWQRAER